MLVEIILEELDFVKITVNEEDLSRKMSELWSDTRLQRIADESDLPLGVIKNMTFIAFIKSDITGKNLMGYKKYQQTLKDKGFDV